jgi:hypothetical protein
MDKVVEELMMAREPVIGKCVGKDFGKEESDFLRADRCSRIEPVVQETGEEDFFNEACRCAAYAYPEVKWRNGRCPLSDHFRPDLSVKKQKVRVGQQKQKKR